MRGHCAHPRLVPIHDPPRRHCGSEIMVFRRRISNRVPLSLVGSERAPRQQHQKGRRTRRRRPAIGRPPGRRASASAEHGERSGRSGSVRPSISTARWRPLLGALHLCKACPDSCEVLGRWVRLVWMFGPPEREVCSRGGDRATSPAAYLQRLAWRVSQAALAAQMPGPRQRPLPARRRLRARTAACRAARSLVPVSGVRRTPTLPKADPSAPCSPPAGVGETGCRRSVTSSGLRLVAIRLLDRAARNRPARPGRYCFQVSGLSPGTPRSSQGSAAPFQDTRSNWLFPTSSLAGSWTCF